jgi:hypothetical protein
MAGAMRTGFSRRDIEIQQLRRALASAVRHESDAVIADDTTAALRRSLNELQQQLDSALLRAQRQQQSAAEAKARERSLQARLDAAEERARQLEQDLHALENGMRAASGQEADQAERPISLADRTILYVGGRSGTIANLRDLVERLGGCFLHHDGGQTQNIGLLAGFIRRADCVFFPVDCVSHQAMFAVKRHCALSQIPFIALHRSGSGSLMRGVEEFLNTTM